MKQKGFTLIELLAVIVILAIIALIATPIVLNIVEDARNSSYVETANLVVSEAELAYTSAYMAKNGQLPAIADIAGKFEMKGADMADDGTITFTSADVAAKITCTATTSGTFSVSCKINNEEVAATTATMNLPGAQS